MRHRPSPRSSPFSRRIRVREAKSKLASGWRPPSTYHAPLVHSGRQSRDPMATDQRLKIYWAHSYRDQDAAVNRHFGKLITACERMPLNFQPPSQSVNEAKLAKNLNGCDGM